MQPYLSLVRCVCARGRGVSLTLAALYAAMLLLFLLAAADVEINGFREIHIHLLLTHFDLLSVHACGQLFILLHSSLTGGGTISFFIFFQTLFVSSSQYRADILIWV